MKRITHRMDRGLPLGVLALVLLYLPTLGGDWVWDDVYVFRDNPAILEPWILLTTDAWGPTGLAGPDRVPIYRPLAMLSHVPGQWLWRGPRIERILELALHLSIVWAVARFAQRLGSSRTGAWFGAALLAGHPAASEKVAWIAVRGDLLGVTLLTYGFLALSFGRDRLAGSAARSGSFCNETFLFAPFALLVWALTLRRSALPAYVYSGLGVVAYLVVRRALGIPLPGGSGFASIAEALAAIGAVAERAIELLLLPTAPDALHPFEGNLALGAIALCIGIAAFTRLPGRPWLAALLAPLPLLAPSAPASMANGPGISQFCLLPPFIEFLAKIAIFTNKRDGNHGEFQVCTGPDCVTGENTKPTAVCRDIVLNAYLHRKIGNLGFFGKRYRTNVIHEQIFYGKSLLFNNRFLRRTDESAEFF